MQDISTTKSPVVPSGNSVPSEAIETAAIGYVRNMYGIPKPRINILD